MPKIERRRTTVTLYLPEYEERIATLRDEYGKAVLDEETGPKRQGTRSKAAALAKEHDALDAEAEQAAIKVPLWAISYLDWNPIADEHPPRKDEELDKQYGVNMLTFPATLLRASLVPSEDLPTRKPGEDIDTLLKRGQELLDDLGDISRVQYVRLETGAWNVNAGDDALPKLSLVSLHKQRTGHGSKQPNDSE
jgi:hypothetical protein